jgi:hypothetical protein
MSTRVFTTGGFLMKKLLIALLLAALVSTGAFAQLMIGLSGALHMDNQLTSQEIKDRFEKGDGIFYGPTIEIAGRHFGVGVTGNMSSYERDVAFVNLNTTLVDTFTAKLTDYDLTLYLSYHLFGGHALLDPFGEFGGGILATGFKDSTVRDTYNPYEGDFFLASYYWYAALGLGVNLGPIGVFGKFSFNYPTNSAFKDKFKGTDTETELYPYGYDGIIFTGDNGYLPKYRFTAGIKLIL